MTRTKRFVFTFLAGFTLVLPAARASADVNTPKQAGNADPSSYSCTGHLDEPMSEAFYTHCLAPTGDRPDMQAANDMNPAAPPNCPTAPDQPASQTCDARPATLIKSPVPRDGSTMQFISLKPVPFEFDKAVLTDTATFTLDAITAYLRSQPGVTSVLVYGHTDNVGTGKYNYTLSDKRVQVITAYLVSHGIAPSLIHEAPRGERMPVDEYWTPDGRKRNRRVEIYAVVH